MADIKKTLSALQALYADNTNGDISPNDLRDGFKTVVGSMNIVSTSANITAGADNIVFDVDTNAGDVTITIPSANASDGSGDTYEQKVFYFINSGSNNIILSGPSFTVPTNENLAIISNGTTWLKLSKFSETIGSLNNLSDVVITSAQEGESLIYNGSEWINDNPLVYVDIQNGEGSAITRGQPVYVSGSTGGGTPIVSLADNDGAGTNPAIGLVADNSINSGDDGRALISGILENINTSAYSIGDAIYLDNVSGILTNVRPTSASEQVQKVGLVTKVDSISGKMLVIGAGRANDVPNELTALTGVALDATNLGSFTGTTISDNQTIKGAFQDTINSIEGLAKGLDYQGTWNASTNTPTLVSSSGTEGHYYIVATAGSTNLDGITDWNVGDWVIWAESAGQWQQVDNTSFETVTNQGTGSGIFKQVLNGTEVQLRSLVDGSIISFTENADDITIRDSNVVSINTDQTITGKKDFNEVSSTTLSADNIYVANNLTHSTDPNTEIRFALDQIRFQVGGLNMLQFIEGASDQIIFNNGSNDIDFIVESNGDANSLFINGANSNIGLGTNSPSEKLDVNGNALIGGYLSTSAIGTSAIPVDKLYIDPIDNGNTLTNQKVLTKDLTTSEVFMVDTSAFGGGTTSEDYTFTFGLQGSISVPQVATTNSPGSIWSTSPMGIPLPDNLTIVDISLLAGSGAFTAAGTFEIDIQEKSSSGSGTVTQHTLSGDTSKITLSLTSVGAEGTRYYRTAQSTGNSVTVSQGNVLFCDIKTVTNSIMTDLTVIVRCKKT
jgi:hypothetical protein